LELRLELSAASLGLAYRGGEEDSVAAASLGGAFLEVPPTATAPLPECEEATEEEDPFREESLPKLSRSWIESLARSPSDMIPAKFDLLPSSPTVGTLSRRRSSETTAT
jgi:hypothetical protein